MFIKSNYFTIYHGDKPLFKNVYFMKGEGEQTVIDFLKQKRVVKEGQKIKMLILPNSIYITL